MLKEEAFTATAYGTEAEFCKTDLAAERGRMPCNSQSFSPQQCAAVGISFRHVRH